MTRTILLTAALVALTGCETGPQQTSDTYPAAQSAPVSTATYDADHETTPALTVDPASPEEAVRISVAQLQPAMQSGSVVLVDVRNQQAYDMEHAQGAINIPLEQFAARAGELPRDRRIVTYCT